MCGIAGIYLAGGGVVDEGTLGRMTSAMRHRGPDGSGQVVGEGVGLGHVRLSIIDLAGGAQPLGNETCSVQVVFNGEIYNFVELRTELESLGHRFRTLSDTEVIVHAYEQWGSSCVSRFNGMFAFAVWDSDRREVFIARDHLGIKPLYYVDLGTRVLFASEIKALLEDPECPRGVDLESLAELFTFRYVPSPKTLFQRIRKLPPGHSLRLSRQGMQIERYWLSRPNGSTHHCEESLADEYRTLLEDAVRLQLRSDVPLGLFLSSGIDSGVLLALMSQCSSEPVRAFTIGFEDADDGEVSDARQLAHLFGATHEAMIVTAEDYQRYYERYMWDLEEPVGNETAAAFYFVSKIASREVKVALTGQGADEPWAGYQRYVGAKLSTYYSRMPNLLTAGIAGVVNRVPGRFERVRRGATALSEADPLLRLTKVYSFFSEDMKAELYRSSFKATLSDVTVQPSRTLARLQNDVRNLDPLTQMLYIDTRASLPDDLLMVGDKMSMANSLELRVPFLDYRIVEFIERLHPSLKLRRLTGKYLHKKVIENWLPKEFVWRKKKGFSNPVEHWLRGRMRRFVDEWLLSSDSAVRLYFDQEYIRRLLELDRSGRDQLRRQIYLLLSFELWHRRFIGA